MSNEFSVGGRKNTVSDFGIGDLIAALENDPLETAAQPGRRGRRKAAKKRLAQAGLLAPLMAAEGCLTVGQDDLALDSVSGDSGAGGGASGGGSSSIGASLSAQDDIGFNTDTNTDIRIFVDDLLENDIAAAGDTLQLVRVFGATNGTVSLNGNIITFTPNAGYTGGATFTYEVQNSSGQISQATVEIQVADDMGGGHSGGGHSGGGHNTHDPSMDQEMMALMDLVPHADATHVAVQDGSWFDPATWASGQVPGAGAKVLISDGVTVQYDGSSSASLFTVRVDGALEFATDVDTFMEVDTLVVSSTGKLQIGTVDNPVEDGVEAVIQIAENGPIDTSWDPLLLSRGVISHGAVEIHGAEKETFLKVATDPMAGDTSITLDSAPTGWEVGDKLVLTGTKLTDAPYVPSGQTQNHLTTEDEELIITGISGNTITFATPLQFDHDTPRADLKAYVANYSRNIRFETENPNSVPVSERGHVMFMHSDNVDVRYAEFYELGRTDKSVASFSFEDVANITSTTNLRARYPLHLHRTGVDDFDNPAMVVGNAVWGSPGWGLVHHDSNAEFTDNAAYDIYGAAFVAETGNETGRWAHNIAIKSIGLAGGPKDGVVPFDVAKTGIGFWFEGRLVAAVDNVAAGMPAGHGFVYMSRGGPNDVIDVNAATAPQPESLEYLDTATINQPPIIQFSGNEAIATNHGLEIIKANPRQFSDIRSVLEDFTAWEVQTGAYLQYTGHYTLIDFDLVASRTSSGDGTTFKGIGYGPNTIDMVINGANIDGFDQGIQLSREISNLNAPFNGNHEYVFIDVNFNGVTQDYVNSTAADLKLTASDLNNSPFSFVSDIVGIPQAPTSHTAPDSAKQELSGTKVDGIGTTTISSEWDPLIYGYFQLRGAIEQEGYWTLPDGRVVTMYDQYVSDRATGEIHKTGVFVEVLVQDLTPSGGFVRTTPTYNGVLDLNSDAPVARTDIATVQENQSIVIDVLANDYDPDGDTINVDGLIQADHGRISDNGDGTITYTPDANYVGMDYFWYWVEDSNGNFDRAHVQVTVEI